MSLAFPVGDGFLSVSAHIPLSPNSWQYADLISFQILEGLASVVAAVAIFFLMPDYPSTSKRFLTEEESQMACTRLAVDGIGLTQGRGATHIPHWVAFKMTCTDWRVWAQCFMFVLVTGSQTMQYFIPTLVNSFGWTGAVGQCQFTATLF